MRCTFLSTEKIAGLLSLLLMAGLLSSAQTGSAKPSSSGNSASPGTSKAATHKTSSKKRKSRRKGSWRTRGQKKIDPQRVRQIQEALIREHYLSGEPSGVWDNKSQSAMEKFQEDNGWQSKTVPDSRALIKLGLGPDQEHLLNPESAMTTALDPKSNSTPSSIAANPAPTSTVPVSSPTTSTDPPWGNTPPK